MVVWPRSAGDSRLGRPRLERCSRLSRCPTMGRCRDHVCVLGVGVLTLRNKFVDGIIHGLRVAVCRSGGRNAEGLGVAAALPGDWRCLDLRRQGDLRLRSRRRPESGKLRTQVRDGGRHSNRFHSNVCVGREVSILGVRSLFSGGSCRGSLGSSLMHLLLTR